MSPRLFATAFIPFIFFQVIFGIVAGDVEGAQAATGINIFVQARGFSESGNVVTQAWGFITSIPGYFAALVQMVRWDYPFFEGDWNYFRLFLLYPLSGILVFGFITTLARARFRR